jgi:hypothetical protein
MEDDDPHAEEMLEKSLVIVETLAKDIHLYSDEQIEKILLMQQSMEFQLKQNNTNKSIIECRNLYNYISEITK